MGMSIICQTLLEASYVYTGTSGKLKNGYRTSKIASEALAFIHGTGLEITIERFALDLDADRVREEFEKIFKTNH